jgi:N-acetylglutamate synthase-like GNAT family acetyltransferase
MVRQFTPIDQDAARQVVLQGLGEHFGFIDPSLNPDLHDIYAAFIASGHDFFVAEHSGEVVGTVGLLFETGRARIVRMSVLKKYRKTGIASALLHRCIESTRSRGIAELVAFTEPDWHDAIGFYTSRGFRQYGRDDIDIHLRLPL